MRTYQAAALACSLRVWLWGGDGIALCTGSSQLVPGVRFDAIDTSNVGDHTGTRVVSCMWLHLFLHMQLLGAYGAVVFTSSAPLSLSTPLPNTHTHPGPARLAQRARGSGAPPGC